MAAGHARGAVCIGLGVLLGILVHPALAESTWICNLSADGERLYCVDDAEPWTGPRNGHVTDLAPAPTLQAGQAPDLWRSYAVPLWSPPIERAFVEQLAQAAFCSRRSDCRVVVAQSPWLDRPLARTAMAWAHSWR